MKKDDSTIILLSLIVCLFCITALILKAFLPSAFSLKLSVPTMFLLTLISIVIKRLITPRRENSCLCTIFSGIIFTLFSSLSRLNQHSAVIYLLWGSLAFLLSDTILFYTEKRTGNFSKAALFSNAVIIFLASQIFEGLI